MNKKLILLPESIIALKMQEAKILELESIALEKCRKPLHLNIKGIVIERIFAYTNFDYETALENYFPDIVIFYDHHNGIKLQNLLKLLRLKNYDIPFVYIDMNAEKISENIISEPYVFDYLDISQIDKLSLVLRNALRFKNLNTEILESKKRENLYKKLIENNADMTTMADPEGVLIYGSPSVTTFLGYEPSEYIGTKVTEWIHPDDLNSSKEMEDSLLRNQEGSIQTQRRIRHKDGHYLWCEGTAYNYYHDKDINARVSIFRDITDRKSSEVKIKESEKRYRDLFYTNPFPMWITNTENFQLLNVNEAAQKWFGYSREEFLELNSFNLRPESEHDRLRKVLKTHNDSLGHTGIWTYCNKEGKIMVAEVHMVSLVYKEQPGQLVLALDITEKVKSEEKLKKSEANLRTLIENTDTAYILLDEELKILSFNHIFYELIRDISGKVVRTGLKIMDLLPRDFFLRFEENLEEKPNGNIHFEMNYVPSIGISTWYKILFSKIATNTYENFGAIMTIEDITENKIASEKLNKSEAHLIASQAIGHVGSWELTVTDQKDISGGPLYWSAETFRIFGFEENEFEVTGKFYRNAIHPDDREYALKELTESLISKDSYESEHRIIRKDGKVRTIVNLAKIIRNPENKNILKMIGILRDVTEERQAEKELKTSEANLRAILENTDTAYVLTDDDFKVLSFNSNAKKAFKEELNVDIALGEITIDYFSGKRREKLANNFQKVIGGKSVSYESLYVDRKGQNHWYFDRLSPLKDKEGRILGMIMGKREITDMKISELEREKMTLKLARSEANLRTIFENTTTSFILLDLELNIISFNNLAKQGFFSDVGKELTEGMQMLDFIPGERKDEAINLFLRALSGEKISHETDFTGLEGSNTWYNFQFSPISNHDSSIDSILLSITNITERKVAALERENLIDDIIQRNKDLEQFAYIVSHNLRSSVANILGTSAILKEENLTEEEKNFVLNGLEISVTKLDTVIKDLNHILQVKKLHNERKEPVILSELVSEIYATLNEGNRGNRLTIEADFSELNELLSIKSYLHSVFYNLLSNSIKYSKPDVAPVVEITSSITKEGYKIIYRDNGIGLDLKKLGDQVFGLYKRFHFNTEGKGMGLFMVKTQIEAMGGRITLHSEVNQGCEFVINFKL